MSHPLSHEILRISRSGIFIDETEVNQLSGGALTGASNDDDDDDDDS